MRDQTFRITSIRNAALLLATALLLAACNFPGAAPATSTVDLQAVVAATQTAMATQATGQPPASPSPAEATTPAPATLPASQTAQPSDTLAPPTATPTSGQATETQQPDCIDAARFESETIPDKTPFQPGEKFTKVWRLRNVGTCTWNNGYRLVYFDGDQMGGPDEAPLTVNVRPDEMLEIKLELTAPDQVGTYRGDWKLRNAAGETFGLGSSASAPFWVEITVTSAGEALDLGTPDWLDSFDANLNRWYLGQDNDFQFQIKDGALLMTAFSPGGDQWRVAQLPPLENFYLEAKFRTGELCSGKDSYGLIVRAPIQTPMWSIPATCSAFPAMASIATTAWTAAITSGCRTGPTALSSSKARNNPIPSASRRWAKTSRSTSTAPR